LEEEKSVFGLHTSGKVTLALIYLLVEFGGIWKSSSLGGPNPWSSQFSAGRTSSLRVRPNPRFCIGVFTLHFSLWEAYLAFLGDFCSRSYLFLEAI